MSAITPFVNLEVVSAEELTEAPPQSAAQLLAPATYSGLGQASVALAVPDSEIKQEPRDASGREEDQGDDSGRYRKRGRPRKYEGLDEEERRKRRMCVPPTRESAARVRDTDSPQAVLWVPQNSLAPVRPNIRSQHSALSTPVTSLVRALAGLQA
jgi:hypothetical protein